MESNLMTSVKNNALAGLCAVAALTAAASGAYATTIAPTPTITATYSDTTVYTGSSSEKPTISTLSSSIPALTLGQSTGELSFFTVSPTSSTKNDTVTGIVTVNFALTDPTAVKTATSGTTAGGIAPSAVTNGQFSVTANYQIDYANSTDCISWTVAACTLPGDSSVPDSKTLGDTVVVTFADGAVLDLGLWNWADWNMQPGISYDLVSDPTSPKTVAEPMSMALLGVGMVGVGAMRRRARAPQASA
jgi:hypothetical protein